MSGDNQRLDAALVARGLASGREKAKELIAAGLVTVNGTTITKPSRSVADTDAIECVDTLHRYVGRGGEKLEKVLRKTDLSPAGCCCIDIGASTGGFTDCLLQNGAFRVYALDVGHGQLHPQLCEDARVVNMEGTDVRRTADILAVMGGEIPSIGVVDVSFISLETIWHSVEPLLTEEAAVVCLIKPQFEAGRAAIGKKGVVKDPKVHVTILRQLLDFWYTAGWRVSYLDFSPITGGEGNIEYLAVVNRTTASSLTPWQGDIRALVQSAHATLR